MLNLSQIEGFDWNNANKEKNWLKHRVSPRECEEVFFDSCSRVLKDAVHSGTEPRLIILGRTKSGRLLFIVFTVRKKRIRIISARDLKKKKESKLYEERV